MSSCILTLLLLVLPHTLAWQCGAFLMTPSIPLRGAPPACAYGRRVNPRAVRMAGSSVDDAPAEMPERKGFGIETMFDTFYVPAADR